MYIMWNRRVAFVAMCSDITCALPAGTSCAKPKWLPPSTCSPAQSRRAQQPRCAAAAAGMFVCVEGHLPHSLPVHVVAGPRARAAAGGACSYIGAPCFASALVTLCVIAVCNAPCLLNLNWSSSVWLSGPAEQSGCVERNEERLMHKSAWRF